MESAPKQYHFVVFPYSNLKIKEWNLGFAKIWNFDLMKEVYIPDAKLRNQVAKVLSNYTAQFGGVNGIGIGLIGENDYRELTLGEYETLNEARLILFISTLAKSNTVTFNGNVGHSMFSSENFEYARISVALDTEYMTETTGFVIPSWHGGVKIVENKIIRPRHVPTPFRQEVEGGLLNSLLTLRKKKPLVFYRVISAISIFYESYYNSHQISHNARILLQASAFEVLLQAKLGKGRETMKNFVKKYANYPEDKVLLYKSKRSKKASQESGTIKEVWADKFFTLRNDIIHGHIPKPLEFNFRRQRHFDIALYFFIFTIKRVLERVLRKQIFDDDLVWKTWKDKTGVQRVKYTGFGYVSHGRRAWKKLKKRLERKQTAFKI